MVIFNSEYLEGKYTGADKGNGGMIRIITIDINHPIPPLLSTSKTIPELSIAIGGYSPFSRDAHVVGSFPIYLPLHCNPHASHAS